MLQYQSANLTFRTVHMAKQNFEVIQIGKWRVLVDKKDAKRVLFKKWRIYLQGGSPRIVTNVTCDRQMTLARFILCPGRNEIAFPKSVNKVGGCWDFRRENLTLGRRGDRIRFLPKNSKRRTSRYKGVSKDAGGMWRASISVNGTSKNLGAFRTEREAAKAYNAAVFVLLRRHAFLNSF